MLGRRPVAVYKECKEGLFLIIHVYKGIVTEHKMKITRCFSFIAYSWVQYFTAVKYCTHE